MPKRYDLAVEAGRVAKKYPAFELVLPEVGRPGDDDYKPSKTVTVPSAQTLPDDVVTLSGNAPVAAAKLVLGDDYEQFVAGGGSASLLFTIIRDDSEGAGDTQGE